MVASIPYITAQLRLAGPNNSGAYQAEGLYIFDWEKIAPAVSAGTSLMEFDLE